METTYIVTAKCNRASGINVEFKGIGDWDNAVECAVELTHAFPQVDIVCEQTGEVMYSRYISVDIYKGDVEMGKAIFNAECELYF